MLKNIETNETFNFETSNVPDEIPHNAGPSNTKITINPQTILQTQLQTLVQSLL